MKSTVEQLSPTRVRINVEVPFTELEPDFDARLQGAGQAGPLPGFRPGKAPAKLLEARVGRGAVLEQVVNDALPARYSEAVTTTEIKPLGQPDIEVTKIEDGEELVFTAEVDVRPEIALPDLSALKISSRPDRDRRRGRRQRTAVAARPVRHPDRCRARRRRTATSSRSTCRRPSTARTSPKPRPRACRTRSVPVS